MITWANAVDDMTKACRDQFGREVTYRPGSGEPVQIIGIFDQSQEMVEIDAAGMPVSFHRTTLFIRLADVPFDPAEGDQVEVNASIFRVDRIQRPNPSVARLILNPV